jgi:hypothetical protein
MLRKATFLANDFWVTLPCQRHQAAPLQSLLSVAASIPAVLEKVDSVLCDAFNAAPAAASQLIGELTESKAHLEAWHTSFADSSPGPLYWRRTIEHDIGGSFESIWYHDLSTANVFIYFWAFHLICLVNIKNLWDRFPTPKPSGQNDATHGAEARRDECSELSTRIYQSMEFVLQPEFMLYGISSAGFPLQIACETLKAGAKGREILDMLDPSIVVRSQVRRT